jgi:hypothetical protein
VRIAIRLSLSLIMIAAAAVAVPAADSAPASTSFAIAGYEYAFTSTVGSFAGGGTGNAGGTAYWNATVKHDRLGSNPTYVNGGSFAMTVRGSGRSVDAVVGTFVHHGGKITTLDSGAGCTNQKYRVADSLKDVATSTTANGAGRFSVTLTHYRHRLLDHCVAYKARVSGTVSFTY